MLSLLTHIHVSQTLKKSSSYKYGDVTQQRLTQVIEGGADVAAAAVAGAVALAAVCLTLVLKHPTPVPAVNADVTGDVASIVSDDDTARPSRMSTVKGRCRAARAIN